MTVDRAFEDPRLAALYDALNPWGPADEFYLTLMQDAAVVLDVGCGTGELLCRTRAAGHEGHLTGADPAEAMLAIARAKRADVEWVRAGAETVATPARYDLVTMTGHAFQVLLDDAATLAALRNLARHLAPGGLLAFETRNPAARAWTRWRPEATTRTVTAPDGVPWTVAFEVREVHGDLVTFDATFTGPETLVSRSTLRFPALTDVERLLHDAGLRVVATYGDWDRSAVTAASPEIVVLAR